MKRQWAADRSPPPTAFFMAPSAFVLLEAMPLNPNGKIDRTALAQELAA